MKDVICLGEFARMTPSAKLQVTLLPNALNLKIKLKIDVLVLVIILETSARSAKLLLMRWMNKLEMH